MKTDLHKLQQKLDELKEKGDLNEDEYRFLQKRIGNDSFPWLSVTSLIFSSLGLVLLDANISFIDEMFTIADGAAAGGLILGILAIGSGERNRFIAVISILLALFVLLSINIVIK